MQPTKLGCIGIIKNFGTKYIVNKQETIEVYVEINNILHVFNNYHLKMI